MRQKRFFAYFVFGESFKQENALTFFEGARYTLSFLVYSVECDVSLKTGMYKSLLFCSLNSLTFLELLLVIFFALLNCLVGIFSVKQKS